MDNKLSLRAAWAIATVLNQASMDVSVIVSGNRPVWTGCTGAQVLAAAARLVKEGGALSAEIDGIDWLTASFEEYAADNAWSSAELTLR